jgi:hypothetical protein
MLRIFLPLAAFAILLGYPLYIYLFSDQSEKPKGVSSQRRSVNVPYRRFGKGSLSYFDWYLERPSLVEVKSIRDICEWLMGCQYIHDQELFNRPDIWQHPVDFEAQRQGDCEDHTLWAWRKLHDLGLDAEFVVGKLALGDGTWGDHTWIMLNDGLGEHLIETTAKRMDQFMVPPAKARQQYKPYFGMDTKLRSFAYQQPKNYSGG